jgi:hypothetical protein
VSVTGPDGRLEGVFDGIVVGWAYDWSTPDGRVEVDVLVDGEVVARTTADMPREPLVKEGMGDGRHGFYVELPARVRDGGLHSIAAAFSASCMASSQVSSPDASRSSGLLEVSRAFKVTASAAAEEWSGTRFNAIASAEANARALRLRPSIQVQFPRRGLTEGFSEGNGAETIVLADQVSVERSEPLHFSVQEGVADAHAEHRRRFVEHSGDYIAERLVVSRLPGALVDTNRFLICPTERQYLADSIRHPLGAPRWGYKQVAQNAFERETVIEHRDERVVVLGAQTNLNFSHWLVESVVRALLFKPFDDGSIMYLCPRLEPWQHEALALAGVPKERILTVRRRRLARFPEVFAVSRGMSRMPALIPGALSALAALATPARDEQAPAEPTTEPTTGRRRLFVSRAQVKNRHISNEPQLVEVLGAHGFQTVHPEQLSVVQQIELFAGAEAVIGSWGSGLTNLVFSPPGTLVIEMQPEEVDFGGNAFVWNLASIREQPYAQVVCPVTDGMRQLPLGERDMTVDVDEIDALLGQLLAVRATSTSLAITAES